MGVYDHQIATAQRLIKAKGRVCLWRSLDNAAPADPDRPWLGGDETTEDHKVTILFLPDTRMNLAYLRTLIDDTINVGDDHGIMAAVDFVPTTRAQIYDETGTTLLREIKSVEPLAPNGDIILYTLRFTVAT